MGKALLRFKRVLSVLQTGWSILGITLVVILILEAGFRIAFAVRDRLTAQPVPDRRVLAEGYGGETWPIEHYRELESARGALAALCLLPPQAIPGSDDHDRHRRAPRHLAAPVLPATIAGAKRRQAPDAGRILALGLRRTRRPARFLSLVARMLHERGWRVEIRNLSEIGYVSTQELIALSQELQAGYRPDVVIFFDGVNDTTSALLEREAGLTTNEINRRQRVQPLAISAAAGGCSGRQAFDRFRLISVCSGGSNATDGRRRDIEHRAFRRCRAQPSPLKSPLAMPPT